MIYARVFAAGVLVFAVQGACTDGRVFGQEPAGPPKLSVAEFQRLLNEPKFLSRQLVGREFAFTAIVEHAGPQPIARILGLHGTAKDMGSVRLVTATSDLSVNVGDHLNVRGLILQDDFAVWSVWVYEVKLIQSENGGDTSRSEEDAPTADPFVGTFVRALLLSDGGARLSIVKDGDYYRLNSANDQKQKVYEQYRFIRAADGQLRDEDGSLGTITLGYVHFGDGRKPRMLKVNFCYEHFLLLDVQGQGFTP